MDSTQRLTEAYRAILADLPRHWLDRSRHHEAEFAKLSGLFLPGTSAAYGSAIRRIMVVGRETRRWNVVSDAAPFLSLDDYIRRAMDKQQAHLTRYLPAPLDKDASFFNLLRALAADHGGDGIAWANLFGFAWNGKSPMRWSQFPILLEVSERLLKAQLDILAPDIVIFANGASSARFRQRYFPHKGEHSVCSEFADYRAQGIPLDQLWRFRLRGTFECYRIQHPSSISAPSRAARRFLLGLLRAEGSAAACPASEAARTVQGAWNVDSPVS